VTVFAGVLWPTHGHPAMGAWFNHVRLLTSIGSIPPAEAEANYWRQLANSNLECSRKEEMTATTSSQYPKSIRVQPLLTQGAIERTGNAELPGTYCEQRHVWLVDGTPAVQALTGLAELVTKTNAQLERDDNSDPTLLELQTKTMAQMEQDDQEFSAHLLGLTTKTRADTHERDD